MNRTKLLASFSGGRTSGYMTRRLLTEYSDSHDIVVVFANTGEEREETLEFVDACDREFNFQTVWVENVVVQGRRTDFRVTNFQAACRRGEPFEEMIRKYGIPNQSCPHCTRSLKRYPIEGYLRSIGWKRKDYVTAIGIRSDEARRAKVSADRKIVYPLIDWFPTDKIDVNDWWEEQRFNLRLLEHQGNCKWCWKKSLSKHARIIRETPEAYDFPRRMEADYGHIMPPTELAVKSQPTGLFQTVEVRPLRTFFRGKLSTVDLFSVCVNVQSWREPERSDENSGCSESCELFPTDGSDDDD